MVMQLKILRRYSVSLLALLVSLMTVHFIGQTFAEILCEESEICLVDSYYYQNYDYSDGDDELYSEVDLFDGAEVDDEEEFLFEENLEIEDDSETTVEYNDFDVSDVSPNAQLVATTHEELLDLITNAQIGIPTTIFVSGNITGDTQIPIHNGRQIVLQGLDNTTFIYTQTGARHFEVSGANSSLTLNGAILSGGELGETVRGGINVQNNAVLILNSSTINGNFNLHGGAVLVNTGARFYLNSGYIENNTANQGAGISVMANSSLILNGGIIRNNEARIMNATTAIGGGILVVDDANNVASITVSSGSTVDIYNNRADGLTDNRGGGISVSSGGHLNIHGTLNLTNNASQRGGGLDISNGSVLVTSSGRLNIVGNSSTNNGAGIGFFRGARGILTNNGQMDIVNNTATNNGAAIYIVGASQSVTVPTDAYDALQFNTPVIFFRNTAGQGSSLPPRNRHEIENIRFISASAHDHPINNHDIVYQPDSPTLIRHSFGGTLLDGTFDERVLVHHETNLFEYGLLPNLIRDGYTFTGWYFDSLLLRPVDNNVIMPWEDELEIYAGWELIPMNSDSEEEDPIAPDPIEPPIEEEEIEDEEEILPPIDDADEVVEAPEVEDNNSPTRLPETGIQFIQWSIHAFILIFVGILLAKTSKNETFQV